MFYKFILIIYLTLHFADTIKADCLFSSVCSLKKVNTIIDASGIERIVGKELGLQCNIHDEFSFKFNFSEIRNSTLYSSRCLNGTHLNIVAELRWPKSPKSDVKSTLLDGLNITGLIRFLSYFYKDLNINLVNVKRFGCNIADLDEKAKWKFNIRNVFCSNCKFEFYNNGKTLKTCEDFIESNVTNIQSIFQIHRFQLEKVLFMTRIEYHINFTFTNADLKHPLCPLVFNNSYIHILQLIGLVDSFYKKDLLSVSNHTFPRFTSSIKRLQLDKVENINLDFELLNRNVFKNIESIYIFGMINKIDEGIFKNFEKLNLISFTTNYFRNIMHKNGIRWIRAINSNISVNLSDIHAVWYSKNLIKTINLECYYYSQEISFALVIPDEDFCLYVDYPFKQLVLLIQICGYELTLLINQEFSCTYSFLIQYYKSYYDMYNIKTPISLDNNEENQILQFSSYILRFLENPQFNSTLLRCNFSHMKSLCDKKTYSVSNIWGLYDYWTLNKKLETTFKISSYIFSFLAIFTNLKVIITILHKDNAEMFKGLKQYDYLCFNSIFSMLIVIIQLMSWMSECFYPYEVFCPEIRKLVFIQVFKMVFKECFITAFRFMWNFTYVAFALNRISLIGKDHGKLVEFVSQVRVKLFIIVTLFLSLGFSVVKYFKYEINFDEPENNYPISNDHDLSSIHRTHISNDGFIIANLIFDLLNYFVFEVIIFVIDIYMLVLFRRILDEKMKKMETLLGKGKNMEKLESMKKENRDAVNKVIKMVVLNTAISVLFRLPIAFIPIVNVFAEFYYKNYANLFEHPKFGEFYSFLLYSGFYDMIVYCSDLLFTISLFIQFFICYYFDRNFQTNTIGFRKLFKSEKKS